MAGVGGGAGLEAKALVKWERQLEAAIQSFTHSFTPSFIHSFHILVYLLYARHWSECWEKSKNKIKSLPLRVYVLMSQLLALVTGVSPSCPCPGPLHGQPGRQMLDLVHLRTFPGHQVLCVFPAPRKYKASFSFPLPGESSRRWLQLHSDGEETWSCSRKGR